MSLNITKITTKLSHSPIIKGTIILTLAGMIGKILGFVYRIVLTRCIGSEGLGLYQVVLPIAGIVFSICCAGFQSAISRYTAKNPKDGALWLLSSLIPSLMLALAAMFVTNNFSDVIAERILLFKDADDAVKMLSWSFPFIALHDCCCGYFYGQKKTAVPALSQLAEQIIRISVLILCTMFLTSTGTAMKPHHAIIGNIAGEAAAAIYVILFIMRSPDAHICNTHKLPMAMKEIFFFSLPMSVNSLLIHLFQSAEAVLIPAQLIIYGYTSSESLKLYGILSGMVLPLIMFPSVLTGSLAVLLMPSVAENSNSTKSTICKTIKMCISLGIYSISAYYIFVADIGQIMFDEPLVYDFTRLLAWLCPFMYLSSTMSSIINGAGKTTSTCIQNTLGIIIRLITLITLVPAYGITAYLYGLLASKIIVCLIQYIQINHLFHIKMDTGGWIIKSALYSVLSVTIAFIAGYIIKNIPAVSDTQMSALITDTASLCLSAVIFFIQLYILSRSTGADKRSAASS